MFVSFIAAAFALLTTRAACIYLYRTISWTVTAVGAEFSVSVGGVHGYIFVLVPVLGWP
jgi:hypothetical protein